jgi:NADH dehydrogenase [ubiquinone] 1 alpha subcomplex assembly factor 7
MTPLEALLLRRIAATGPMTLADYMAECLGHPEHGYYTTRSPFGAAGDFTTAPEISQMFGELLGLWLAQCWLDQGAPARFTLAEIGPGRGTLMADALRAARVVPGFLDAAQVVLVETSPALRDVQKSALAACRVEWADHAAALPDEPLFLIANEFFDALPIRQFTRDPAGWRETVVGIVGGKLALGRTDPAPVAPLAHRLADTRRGDIVEHCPQAAPIVTEIGSRIARRGGAALIIDYGGWRSLGDTTQAVRRHESVPFLATPGAADLTAHVDFEALARAAAPCATRYTTQGALLARLGIASRALRLAQSLDQAGQAALAAASNRLTLPSEMGTLFKALAIFPANAPPPPGFD